jgi:hypothetical protein
MTRLKKWLLRRLIWGQIQQGPRHGQEITDLYRTIFEASRHEFNEDNPATLQAYLTERFDAALKSQEAERGQHLGTQEHELRPPYLS